MAQPLGEQRIATIGSYRLYIEPDGKLFVNTGAVKLRVSPQEARDLLDFLLLFASHFSEGVNLRESVIYTENGYER
jgi:hypothetical protein